MSNEQIVRKIQEGESVTANMEALWMQNCRFVARMAKRYRGYAEWDDLMQEGYLGLCSAEERYRPEEGNTFLTYAAYWIKRAMIHYIRSNGTVRIPVDLHSLITRYERVKDTFLSEYGREPDHREISRHLAITVESVPGLKKAAGMKQIGSLDSPVETAEGLVLADCIPGDENVEENVLEDTQGEQLRAVLWPLVDELPGQQAEVIRKKYQDGSRTDEIAKVLSMDAKEVNQLQRRAMRELRRPDRAAALKPFLYDAVESCAYHGGAKNFQRTWTSSTERTALRMLEEAPPLRDEK